MNLSNLAEAAAQQRLHGAVVSIGNFDGVHLGHRALLSQMQQDGHGRARVVVTFFPPAKVYFSGAKYLSSAEEKQALLAPFQPDAVITVPFTEQFSHTTAQQFVNDLAGLKPAEIVVGSDFRFGQGRQGGLNDLAGIAPVVTAELLEIGGSPVGSSRIRSLLAEGQVELAAELLGRPYQTQGTVVVGHRRGNQIGYPTANLVLPEQKALPRGVYAVTTDTELGTFGGMANVGARPTFPDGPPSLEVNLFDFNADIYDSQITVHFVSKLRDQRRFGSIEELTQQLATDRLAAQAVLSHL